MSGGSGASHRATILIIIALLAVPAATLLTFHILQDRRYSELIAELEVAAVEFTTTARVVCEGDHVSHLAASSDQSAGDFESVASNDNRADRRWRTWYFDLRRKTKVESCSTFGFQLVCQQRRKWKIFLAPQVNLNVVNLPADALLAWWDQDLKARGVPYTVTTIISR